MARLRAADDGADVARVQAAVDQVVAATARGSAPRPGPARATSPAPLLAVGGALATERSLRAALDAIPDAWLFLRSVWHPDGGVEDFVIGDLNAAALRLAGLPRETVVGRTLCELFPIHHEVGLFDWYRSVAETGDAFEDERCLVDAVGEELWLHVRAVPIPGGVALATRDVTERRRVEAARARLAAIVEAMPDVVCISGVDGRVRYLNGAGRALLGVPEAHPEAVLGDGAGYELTVADVQPQFTPRGAQYHAVREAAREGVWRGEATLRKRDGREVPVEQVLLAHRRADGRPGHFSAILRDVTDRKQTEEALRALSLVDELTGLYNRRGFLTLAAQLLDRARARQAPVLAFYMDLDDFKGINDRFGHAEGDVALKTAAAVLRRTFRESDIIGRLGGDEFVVFATHGAGQPSAAIAAAVTERLEGQLAAAPGPAAVGYRLAMSVGVALEPHDPAAPAGDPPSLDALLAEADAALYEEKCRRKAARAAAAAALPA